MWFFLYANKKYPLNAELLGSEELALSVSERDTVEQKWEYVRQSEEVKIDWQELYKSQFEKTIEKKNTKFQDNYAKFFGFNPKRLPKNILKHIKGYKFNIKISINKDAQSFIIPASKINYFEHSLSCSYFPKKLVTLSSIKNVQIEAISKQNDIKLKLRDLTEIDMCDKNVHILEDMDGLRMHTVSGKVCGLISL